jgi:hypothetical protein
MFFFKALLNKSNGAVWIFIIYSVSICCGTPKDEQIESPKNNHENSLEVSLPDTIKGGHLYPKIVINHDELNTFALYIPKFYRPNKFWPAVFFFDAEGAGTSAIEKYKSIADSLGFILIGSNASKNGQTPEESLNIWQSLKTSCLYNLPIDKNKVILAGFSGGARVCCTIAATEPSTFAVIANSAGAQQLDKIFNQNTIFIGLAGNGDMNRAEMLGIEQQLYSATLTHYYIEFDGIHEWAPPKIMHKALMMVILKMYQKNPTEINDAITEGFISNQKLEIEKLKEQGKWIEAYRELELLNKGTLNLIKFEFENLDSLKINPNYIAQKSELLKITAKETEIQQELYQLMIDNPNPTAWKAKIDQIRKSSVRKNMFGQMNQRLLGYASLVCYSLSNRMLVAKKYPSAENIISCYEIADPNNPEVYFFKALVAGSKQDKETTLAFLKKAIQLNLKNQQRISFQSEFLFMKDQEAFKELLK